VLLADTTGELMGFYGIADVVFVGKSLCAHGSQNMIEPCLCAKPVLVGPYTENFRPVMDELLADNAVVQVRRVEEVAAKLEEMLFCGDELGKRAAAAVESRRGVVAKCVERVRGVVA
jgi:3-deoxy-D-manno-octulosonic-acid transferase